MGRRGAQRLRCIVFNVFSENAFSFPANLCGKEAVLNSIEANPLGILEPDFHECQIASAIQNLYF